MKRAAIALCVLILAVLAALAGKQVLQGSKDRAAWAPTQNDEADGIIFHTTGFANQTLNVSMFPKNLVDCDQALAVIQADHKLYKNLYAKGFRYVECKGQDGLIARAKVVDVR